MNSNHYEKTRQQDLAEKRKFYSKASRKFELICKYIENTDELPDETKQLFIECDGEPIQSLLYNTIIYNMEDMEYQTVVEISAELYHYQRELNRRIGRTYYEKKLKDVTLMRHIYEEITYRFPEVKKYLYDEKYENDVHDKYLQGEEVHVSEAVTAADLKDRICKYIEGKKGEGITCDKLIEELKEFLEHNVAKPIKEEENISFKEYFEKCLRRNRDENNPINSVICNKNRFVTQLERTRKDWYTEKLPDKDELYIICIALSLSFNDYDKLRKAAEWERKDSTVFADNIYSNRDRLIQTVLGNIDGWYEQVRHDTKLPIECVPKKVLQTVDDMLRRHDCEPLYEK